MKMPKGRWDHFGQRKAVAKSKHIAPTRPATHSTEAQPGCCRWAVGPLGRWAVGPKVCVAKPTAPPTPHTSTTPSSPLYHKGLPPYPNDTSSKLLPLSPTNALSISTTTCPSTTTIAMSLPRRQHQTEMKVHVYARHHNIIVPL